MLRLVEIPQPSGPIFINADLIQAVLRNYDNESNTTLSSILVLATGDTFRVDRTVAELVDLIRRQLPERPR